MANNSRSPYPLEEFMTTGPQARKCSSSFLLYDKLSTCLVTCFILIILIQLDYTVIKLKNQLPEGQLRAAKNNSGQLKFSPINLASISSSQYPPVNFFKCLTSANKSSCLDICKNVTVSHRTFVIFCPPMFKNKSFNEGSLLIFHKGQLAAEFTGSDCNLLINWIRACSRSDYAGCVFSYNKLKARSKECYIKSLLSDGVYMCFNDKYQLIHMILKENKLDLSESVALIQVLLKLFK